jgi:hypothetical protein
MKIRFVPAKNPDNGWRYPFDLAMMAEGDSGTTHPGCAKKPTR